MSKFSIITLLESVLGKGKINSNDNVAFHCPFCHHNKKKMEVNIVTQYWHCWVCNAAGRKIHTLFRKLKVDRSKFVRLAELIEDVQIKSKYTSTNTPVVTLPSEYKPLWKQRTDPEFRNAFHYLAKRGITLTDILKYRIGYCDSGQYEGKIIIPSYDDAANLNYFVARAYYKDDTLKYKNPSISKNVVGFELHVDWKQPIVLVEGVFDAIMLDAVAILGSEISAMQKQQIDALNRKVIIVPDRDRAGSKLIDQACDWGWSVSMPPWHEGIKDVNNAVLKYGKVLTMQAILKHTHDTSTKIKINEKLWI